MKYNDPKNSPTGPDETAWVKNNAYYRSEALGFPVGRDLEIWLAAKNEFSMKFYGKPFPPQPTPQFD